ADVGVIDLNGSAEGAITCFQGLRTNDLEKPGDGAFVYGALLTPKGMIVVDGWAARLGSRVRYTVPAEGRERALAILQRSVPPRLARSADRTDDTTVLRLAGAHAAAVMGAAGLPVPHAANRVMERSAGDIALQGARTRDVAPLIFQLTVAAQHAQPTRTRFSEAG